MTYVYSGREFSEPRINRPLTLVFNLQSNTMDFKLILSIILALLSYSGARRAGVPATVAAGLALGVGMATNTLVGDASKDASKAAAAASIKGDAAAVQAKAGVAAASASQVDSTPTSPGVVDAILGIAKGYPVATMLGAGAVASAIPSWAWFGLAALAVYIITK